MIRNIKVLGIAVVAVLAMSALFASAALAGSPGAIELGEGSTATAKGEQVEGKHVFSVDGSNVECNNATFTGTISNNATTSTVHPSYTNCEALFGFVEGTVNTTGCDYEASAPEELTSTTWTGQIKLVCSGSNKIVITAGTCEATVSPQTISSGLKWTNVAASPMDVTLKATNAPVTTQKTKDGFICPFSGTGSTTGTYSGNTTIRAYSGETQVGLTIAPEGTEPSPGKVELGSGSTATAKGEQVEGRHAFAVDNALFECGNATFTGTISDGAIETTVHPSYTNCEWLFGSSFTVNTTGCDYEASAPEELTSTTWTGQIKLVCSGSNKIVITAGTCEATVSPQTISSGLKWTNVAASPMDVTLTATKAPVTVQKTKDGALCPFSGTGSTTGSYSGNTTIRAYSGETQVGLTIE